MKKGDAIRINYVGRLESGEVFDLTYEDTAKKENVYNPKIKYGPVPVIVGANFVIKGLEKAISEMNVGDKRSVEIQPDDAFGQRDPRLVRVVSEKEFRSQKVEPQPGLIVDFGGMKGRIQSVSGGRVRIDFNNPLAGKLLKYEIEIVEQINDPKEKIQGVFEFFGFRNTEVSIDNKEATVKISLPSELKQKLSSVILDNMPEVEKISFVESFEKKKEEKNE